MQRTDFDYILPPDLIAKTPPVQRTESRMMLLDRFSGDVRHSRFRDLAGNLQGGDLIVMNDTRVIPARLLGKKETGGKVEVFLNECLDPQEQLWDCLTKSSKSLKPGTVITFSSELSGEIMAGAEEPKRLIRFLSSGDIAEQLEKTGHMPLPPYIDRDDSEQDRERYQTVFAKRAGALAAPTAGLHFDTATLDELQEKGVEIAYVTLHVGLGTFLPVRVDDIRTHQMHEERYTVPPETAAAVNRAKNEQRRVIAIGTTVARTLESTFDSDSGGVSAGEGRTDIFIYPGYRFKVIDGLLTNFHLPQSTLLMLVSAFAGREQILDAYRQAIEERYRFYSYGDCMLIS